MKLADAASYFDNQSYKDAYSGDHAFYGQLDLYDDARREGLTVSRRIISMKPGLTLPTRRAVTLGSDVWLLSASPSTDYFQGAPIRTKAIAHRADGLGALKTVAQELANAAGTPAYGALVWVKGMKEVDESSDVDSEYVAYFPAGETIAAKSLVSLRGLWFFVRYTYLTTSGFLAAVVDQLDAPNFESVTYAKRVYDPVADAHTSTTATIKALRLRWQLKFEYLSPAVGKYAEGDDVVMVRASDVPAPTTGDLITLSDGVRRVDDIQADGTLWHLKVRRA
jgi:hypothetical protein